MAYRCLEGGALNGYYARDMWMWIVVHEGEVLELEIEQVFYLWVNNHFR
jgi:hypothetical protein